MPFSFWHFFYASTSFLLIMTITIANAQSCTNCFVQSLAAFYPNSELNGTDTCGFGSFGATVNGGNVSATSSLYRDGVGCGACYLVICTNTKYCSENGVIVTVTDHGSSGDDTDFILSEHAFTKMARTADAAASLLALGVVDVRYKRVSCSYPGQNITFKIDESSSYPNYLAFAIYYQQGQRDITAVQLCETQSFTCKLLERGHGAVWTTIDPPIGQLSIRMLFSNNGDESNDAWVVPADDIPTGWKPGAVYDSGVQVIS